MTNIEFNCLMKNCADLYISQTHLIYQSPIPRKGAYGFKYIIPISNKPDKSSPSN